jgi:hypothetical protein
MNTYSLRKGKQSQITTASGTNNNDSLVQCQFKGNFLLYKENRELDPWNRPVSYQSQLSNYANYNENQSEASSTNSEDPFDEDFRILLKRYGGFLKMSTPANTPVKIKVRVYIIKAYLYDSITLNNCEPYVSINIGDEHHNKSEPVKTNKTNINPLFAQSFEFDIKFPYDSQLSISVKDDNLFGQSSLIGRTVIDLEDRYYSDRYATCGLSKVYEETGYNAWRDCLKPVQILLKLCQEWRIQKPIFLVENEKMCLIMDSDSKPRMYRLVRPTILPPTNKKLKKASKHSNNVLASASNSPESFLKLKEEEQERTFEVMTSTNYSDDMRVNKQNLALMVLHDWHSITGVLFFFFLNK